MPQEGNKRMKSKLAILSRWMKVKGTCAAASETLSDDDDSDNNEISNFAGISNMLSTKKQRSTASTFYDYRLTTAKSILSSRIGRK